MQSLTDKVVAITGASRGIGAAMARRFALEGTRLIICSRNKHQIETMAKSLKLPPGRVIALAADISTSAGMARFVQTAYRKFGRIDLFINNAGVWKTKPTAKISDQEYHRLIATNLSSVFFSFRELIPRMKKQGGGQIINISSGAGRIPIPELTVYCAAKAAVNMITAATAREVRNDGIKISVLSPGPVETGVRKSKGQPKGKVTVEQVADAACALAMQDHEAFSWMVDVRPLKTDTPFV